MAAILYDVTRVKNGECPLAADFCLADVWRDAPSVEVATRYQEHQSTLNLASIGHV